MKLNWGEKRYYSSLKDDSFMHTKVLKKKNIKNNYRYLPRKLIVRGLRWVFYYFFAAPICFLITKINCGVKVKGRENLKKFKGGAILIGNHSHVLDCMLASVYVGFPRRNYFVSNKDAVQVAVGRYFTKALGVLPLPDEQKGLINLANAINILLKKGNTVTIYPEASIWPYSTFLRPLPPATFHYAVKSDVPVVPFAVTYRYAKFRPKAKKPKVNITILEPIYPNHELSIVERKQDLCNKTTQALKNVIETEDNVKLFEYVQLAE